MDRFWSPFRAGGRLLIMGNEMFSLCGRTAVVIGGASGIGRAIAIGLAKAGADVVPASRRINELQETAGEIERLGRRTLIREADVLDRSSIQSLHDKVLETFGRVDILVNSAGVTQRVPTLDCTEEEWNRIMETNLTGTFRACQIFGRTMVAQKYGRIVNIASLSTFVAFYDVAAYCASKAGVGSLTKSLGIELSPHGVCVNAIAPRHLSHIAQQRIIGENRARTGDANAHPHEEIWRRGGACRRRRFLVVRSCLICDRRDYRGGRRLPGERSESMKASGGSGWRRVFAFAAIFLLCGGASRAENGADGWLRYAPIQNPQILKQYASLPNRIVSLDGSEIAHSAQSEIARGLKSMLGKPVETDTRLPSGNSFVLGTIAELRAQFPGWQPTVRLKAGGFTIAAVHLNGRTYWLIGGEDARGMLYGSFHLLQAIAEQRDIGLLSGSESPAAPVRSVNQWDNFDGSIERGFAGRSIFFDNGAVRPDLTRAGEYARLLASVGINICTVNNVNADLRTLTPDMIRQFARIADVFRPWGVRLMLSVDLSSPKVVGGLSTFDPVDPRVIAWWQSKSDEIYRQIPNFAGFEIKADSEGPPRSVAIWPHAGRCRQSAGSCAEAPRRYRHVSGLRLRPSFGLAESQGRPRPCRLRHLSPTGRKIRR